MSNIDEIVELTTALKDLETDRQAIAEQMVELEKQATELEKDYAEVAEALKAKTNEL